MNGVRDRLLGAWRMIDWKVVVDGKLDSFLPPLGLARDAGGLLLYTPDGLMSAMLSRSDRPAFAEGSLDGGSVEERAAAFGSLLSYAGTFEVDEAASEVTHIVKYSTHPNNVGQRMKRICIFEGDQLKLDTPPMLIGGVLRASYILWERADKQEAKA